MIKRGGIFSSTAIASWGELRASTMKRLALGYPPAITQWLSVTHVTEMTNFKAMLQPPSVWRGETVSSILLPEVYRQNQFGGELINIPLGIHIQNNALYSNAIFKKLNLPLPNSWQQFLEQAVEIKKAGYIPIALSKELWTVQLLFNTLLLEQLGAKNYREFYGTSTLVKEWEDEIVQTLTTLNKLKEFRDVGHDALSWDQAVRLVGKGEAAMHVLGDFAKGELISDGLVPGKDFSCSLTPGSNEAMLYVVDSFVMLNVQEEAFKAGQALLFDVILDPAVQAAYNSKKGSTPIRRGVDLTKLDTCSQANYQLFQKKDVQKLEYIRINDPVKSAYIASMLDKIWKQSESVDPIEFSRELIKSFEQSFKSS